MKGRVANFSLAPIPGQHVPSHVVQSIARLYPMVRLVWNYDYRCWQMVERMPNGCWGEITLLRDGRGQAIAPNLHNTLGLLQEIDNVRMQTEWDIDRYLAKLDDEREQARQAKIKRMQEQVRPVGEAIWDAATGKIRIPMNGLRRNLPWRRT